MTTFIADGACGLFQFQLSNNASTYELDGQRHMDLAWILSTREDVLHYTLSNAPTPLKVPGLGYAGTAFFSTNWF